MSVQRSASEHLDEDSDTTGYSRQLSEVRDWVVQPHELAVLDDILLLTPYGSFRARKYRPYAEEMRSMLLSTPEVIHLKAISATPSGTTSSKAIPCEVVRIPVTDHNDFKKNEGVSAPVIKCRTGTGAISITWEEYERILRNSNDIFCGWR